MKKYTPKPKIIQRWQVSTFLCQSAIALWIVETIYFQIRDGLHWQAIHRDERFWDFIVHRMLEIGLFILFIMIVDVVGSHVIAAKKEWEKAERAAEEKEDDMRDNNMGERI